MLCGIAESISKYIISIVFHVYVYILYVVLKFPRPKHLTKESKGGAFKIPEPEFDPKMLRRRQYAIDEIVSSEYSYQKYISIILEVYQPLLSKYLTEKQNQSYFGPLIKLSTTSKIAVKVFEEEVSRGAKKAEIGNIFNQKLDLIPVFIPYISNYLNISGIFHQLSLENKAFIKELDQIESENLPFSSLVVAPVQRMPKYVLLLREVLKATPEFHVDHKPLEDAIKKLQREAQIADKSIAEANRRGQLIDLERTIRNCPKLLNDDRRIISRFQPKEKSTELILFNDMILISKEKRELLSRSKFCETKKVIELNKVESAEKADYGVLLKTTGADIKIEIQLRAQELLDSINDLLKNPK
ncbi:RhoGEF domain containing protein [Histomonas meleagridis]|uniref:RhoGEF domain containing protein n=1 Tax=Histomonas meleagridis TaxID=135588 RepID=UPI003559D7E9|nr:RhoGEF domain containing protein [Histomonas meleagridis]KAH0806229.1 RhoGEF domain containing protein [Histomonas meleagridis]